MMIEPDASTSFAGPHNSYLDYAPSSVQVDHSYVEGGPSNNGTLPPSAMNITLDAAKNTPHVPSHGDAGSPASMGSGGGGGGGGAIGTRSKHLLRQRANSVRDGSRSRASSTAAETDGGEVMVPAAIAQEGENQRATGKEADKDKAKMAFSEFWSVPFRCRRVLDPRRGCSLTSIYGR